MPSTETLIARSSVGRALSELRAWSEFGARLRQLRCGINVAIQVIERISGLPLSRIVAIESGMHASPETPYDFTPPTDVELRTYLSALDAESEPRIREAERIRRERG